MKLLIGYDGSVPAEGALFDLTRAGLPEQGRACVLVAVNPAAPPELTALDPSGMGWVAAGYAVGTGTESRKRGRELGRKAADFFKHHFPGWTVKVETPVDSPAHALLRKAEVWRPDLVSLGSHGWTWLSGAFLGSTAQRVMTHAECSVRLGKPKRGGSPAPRLLIAVDGSANAEAAVEQVAGRRWPAGTEARLVAALDFRARLDEAQAEDRERAPHPEGGSKWPWMDGILSRAAGRLRAAGLAASTAILEGDPRDVLLREAERYGADCLFTGRRGLSGLGRLLLGSVSGGVASHAPCSVEIVRAAVEAEVRRRGRRKVSVAAPAL